MKELAALVLILLLMGNVCALALNGTGYPAFDGAELPDDSLGGSFGGERLLLAFDPSADYSNLWQGSLQLCFFAFDERQENYLELYLLLPEDLAAGDGSDLAFASVNLYEASSSHELLYCAAREGDAIDPAGARLELTLDRVDVGANQISASGTLNGLLCAYSGDIPTGETLELEDVRFDFTLPLSQSALPSGAPDGSALPGGIKPAFTLPPDYAEV